MKRYLVVLAVLLACVAVVPVVVQAQSASNPWEQPLTDISTSVIGPVALAAFLIALGVFCFMWWFGWTALGAAVGLVVAGAIMGNAESIASWLGLGG